MDGELQDKVLDLLESHRDMSLATIRPDGWPQATTVGYANDGLTLYFLCGAKSQKAANLASDDRVSLTIDDKNQDVMEIRGLSMAAHAERVTDPQELENAQQLIMAKYPPLPPGFPAEPVDDLCIFRLKPTVISILDYTKGFGHTDLVTC